MNGIPTRCAAWLLLFALLAACVPQTPQASLPPSPSPTATPEVRTIRDVLATPSSQAATAGPQTPEPSAGPSSFPGWLTLWTVEAVSPQAEDKAAEVFASGIKAFEEGHPDITVSVVLKNDSGKGSVLDYLRAASQVAPSILPDVVVLNTVDLAPVARAGLLVPLDGLISDSLVNDLLPGARAAGTVDGQLVGIPFDMDIEHLIYNTNKVPSSPLLWTDVISADTSYVFPAKGRNGLVNDAFLIQYLALGGSLENEDGLPYIDEQKLRLILDYYHLGVDEGFIPADVLDVGEPDEMWSSYLAAEVGMAHVTSHRFLKDRSLLHATRFAAIPTRDGNPVTIGRGRALAVVDHHVDRAPVAARLIEWFMEPDNSAAWTQATAYVPTRYAVFARMEDSDPYWLFLQSLMEIAVPPPEYDQTGRVLQQAVIEVLSQETLPEEAAAAAVEAMAP